jgi:hypothetical protein
MKTFCDHRVSEEQRDKDMMCSIFMREANFNSLAHPGAFEGSCVECTLGE